MRVGCTARLDETEGLVAGGGREKKKKKSRHTRFFPRFLPSLLFIFFSLLPIARKVSMDPSARMAVLARQLGAGLRQGEDEEEVVDEGRDERKAFILIHSPSSSSRLAADLRGPCRQQTILMLLSAPCFLFSLLTADSSPRVSDSFSTFSRSRAVCLKKRALRTHRFFR